MADDIQSLPDDPVLLKQMLAKFQEAFIQEKEKYQQLLEQFRIAQHKCFGKGSEVSPGQRELFNEAQSVAFILFST